MGVRVLLAIVAVKVVEKTEEGTEALLVVESEGHFGRWVREGSACKGGI